MNIICNTDILGIVHSVFEDHGFPDVGGQSSFSPHLTIAKMSLGRGGRRGRRKGKGLVGLREELYQEFKDTDFGTEKVLFPPPPSFSPSLPPSLSLSFIPFLSSILQVAGMELLSMVHPPDEDGYYHCFQQYSFEEDCISNSED